MKTIIIKIFFVLMTGTLAAQQGLPSVVRLSKEKLRDKIMGGWAGQTIGVTFGGPYEFQFNGTFISDYQSLTWYDEYVKNTMINNPGLYDDLYMDLTFVDVFEKYGLDAPVDSFASAFANAGYMLWHANQAARYNILSGLKPPESGHWKNNPHADCIDYQIESDFAGLMSPGMPNTASEISDRIGHIMNYGDGWYGGVYMGAMYSLAFVSDDIEFIVEQALRTIPAQSDFHKCIRDVIGWYRQYPGDWKQTWMEVQKKWAEDKGCPEGVFVPFNIDATVNAAYVVIGLLYGKGDFARTLEISTRCGQDADCNPSSAGGVLGAVIGYSAIPAYWKKGLQLAEEIPFKYTSMSLKNVYEVGMKHALQVIQRNGGSIKDDNIEIKVQQPIAVRFEKSFPDRYPVARFSPVVSSAKDEFTFEFTGTGFAMKGDLLKHEPGSDHEYLADLYINGKQVQRVRLPVDFLKRKYELCWNYDLPLQKHSVRLKFTNAPGREFLRGVQVITYADKPVNGLEFHRGSAAF